MWYKTIESMDPDFQKASALRTRPTDENTEEILELVKNQEKEVNPNLMYENIMLKKACLKPLYDPPLPSITPSPSAFSRKKSKSFPGHSSSNITGCWIKKCELAEERSGRRRKCSDSFFYEKIKLFYNSAKDGVQSHSKMRLRTVSLPPLGFSFDEEFERPECPTPSHQSDPVQGCVLSDDEWKD